MVLVLEEKKKKKKKKRKRYINGLNLNEMTFDIEKCVTTVIKPMNFPLTSKL